ncbi:ubiquitin-protein ligase, putative [Trypanosoma brucei gambiense DAL972]|uniref:HECT-type E3 ubiquitin transferase n=1 Tax=Trypanosoma brucei gambiense (strain MHOM/CI/86/DAL972) TaxID=679716 RepID=C9ZQQ5_TRYB9|nr:ubiquitin-protein ligase, putative [Trypanosoma brucei gambiense DAL972]CBH11735.1 ubiquitin-protein ligase, putative [Trypanosoma brucei gambiense DAL972]|eukprot:XP_011774020.1 ubiquitin-protein ligase, putative [Trypanosoma brucei gambiense DAL972]
MHGNFVFTGKSRPNRLTLSNDRQPSKNVILNNARAQREQRQKEKRECQAATCIQRNTRGLLARMALAELARAALKEIKETQDAAADGGTSSEADEPLERLCWLYEFVRRGIVGLLVCSVQLRECSQILLNRLSAVLRGGALEEQLLGFPHAIMLLMKLTLEAYLTPSCDEEAVVERSREHLQPLASLFAAAKKLGNGADILICALDLVIRHNATPDEEIISALYGLYATLSPAAAASSVQSTASRTLLAYAVGSTSNVSYYLSPTTCALSVLLGTVRRDCYPRVSEETNAIFLEAIVDVTLKILESTASSPPLQILGKLVRVLPYFHHGADEDAQKQVLRRKWLICLSRATLLCSSEDELIRETLSDFHHSHTTAHQEHAAHKHLSTYLFSTGYGLRLLEEGLRTSLSAHSTDSFSDVNLLCCVFIWPLYKFATASARQRLEATTIISKFVYSSGLLRCLWDVYRNCHSSTFESTAAMSAAELLECVATGKLLDLPSPVAPPTELLSKLSLPRSTHGLFYDPYPAVSVTLFCLMSYFVDATGFLEGLDRCAVFDRADTLKLIFALKGILYQSFFHGVLPYSKCEVVVQGALTLFLKLHVVGEAQSFVPHPSVWIICHDHLLLKTFKSIECGTWSAIVSNEDDEDCTEDDNEEREDGHWAPSLREGNHESYVSLPWWNGSLSWPQEERCIHVLQRIPFTVPFGARVTLLTSFLSSHVERSRPTTWGHFVVRRGCTFADAFDRFADNPGSSDMYYVRFRAANDLVEEGYGDGVYREFLLSLCKEGFAAEHGLFCLTDAGYVYPNPFSWEVTGDRDHLKRIKFLGAMVGRGLRDGVLQDIPFALHFRNAILGRSNSINNLRSFDSQLYRHLVSLMSLSEEEIENLELNFTYTVEALDRVHEVELLHGGRNIAVTRRNCLNYIHLIADFKLNRETAKQTRAFRSGLESIVHRSWLRLFDSNEVMKLFGGDVECNIDVEDWKQHTQYHVPDDATSKPVQVFWEVVQSLPLEQQRKLLKFSTSMNRPPLLGFKFLNPPFKIHVLWNEAEERLPSASTCFCTLKLPPYQTFGVAQQKITAAIEETDDFGLS